MKKLLIFGLFLWAGLAFPQNKNVYLTVYNQDRALVKEVRTYEFRKGINILEFSQVPMKLDPTSVRLKVLDKESQVAIMEQIYREGMVSGYPLVWEVESKVEGRFPVEVTYLTGGLNWHAEYVAVVDGDEKNLELSVWVSLDNISGRDYEDVELRLVAGEVHKPDQRGELEYLNRSGVAGEAPPFEQREFFEYYVYTLSRAVTVKHGETKQLGLFENTFQRIATDKEYIYDGHYFGNNIGVFLNFKNSEKAGLGIPLPAGKVKVYKEDNDKFQFFIGEDKISHTPKDEKVKIFVGSAFNIKGERKQTDYRKLAERIDQSSYAITLRNHKKEKVEVKVIEHFWQGQWDIIESDFPYTKEDARTINFVLSLKPDEEKKINYTVKSIY